MLFERRSGQAVVLWDTDFTQRLDGSLALVFCDAADASYDYQGLGIAALSNVTASLLLAKDPAVSNFILNLASDFIPEDVSVTVEDDIRMDRYRRLIRAYIGLHELAHVIYRILPETIPQIDARIRGIVANIRPSQLVQRSLPKSVVDEEFEAKGLLVKPLEIDDVLAQIERHLQQPRDYEEIWCDVFASEHLLGWALENSFRPEECAVADDLLHLMLAGRIQWASFWDRSNLVSDWRDSSGLSNHENRTNIRGLLMAANVTQAWHHMHPNESVEHASAAVAALITAEGDTLKKRFVDRHHLALGILGGLERGEMFDRADQSWSQYSVEDRDKLVSEMFDRLT